MSANPSPNTTPPPGGPPAATASAQKIGYAFIKQYYKILLTAPSQLNRFYQSDSIISRGMEPSAPASPSPFSVATESTSTTANGGDETPGERVRKAFFDWAGVGFNGSEDGDFARVDFEQGAIDAQESIGGGILLVVTGHMSLPGKAKSSQFVHTFFLNNNSAPGMKKQFLVKNDILRFVEQVAAEDEEKEGIEEDISFQVDDGEEVEAPTPTKAVEENGLVEEETPAANESIPRVEYEPSADEEKVEDDDEAEEQPVPVVQHEIVDVEPATKEEKVDITTETSSAGSESPASSPSSDGKKSKRNKKKKARSNSPRKQEDNKEDTPEKPKAPSSWANLVASGAPKEGGKKGRKGSPKGSRNKSSSDKQQDSAKAPPQSQTPKEDKPDESPGSPDAHNDRDRDYNRSQRKPEATLFIRNVPDKTTESEVRSLFEPHGVKTGNKVLSVTLNPQRGFAFVDFDGEDAALAIVSEASSTLKRDEKTGRKIESAFMIRGRVLEVERKIQKHRG